MARRRKPRQPNVRKQGKPLRNPYALLALGRSGSGTHPDQRKERARKACRGRVNTADDT